MNDPWDDKPGLPCHIYDPAGNPISFERYAELVRDPEAKIVAKTKVPLPGGGAAEVSTVWLGIDHNFGAGVPLIFETMVFMEAGNYGSEDYQERTPSRVAALAAHDQAVEWAKALGLTKESP